MGVLINQSLNCYLGSISGPLIFENFRTRAAGGPLEAACGSFKKMKNLILALRVQVPKYKVYSQNRYYDSYSGAHIYFIFGYFAPLQPQKGPRVHGNGPMVLIRINAKLELPWYQLQ